MVPTKPTGPVADLDCGCESAPGEELVVTGISGPSYLPKTGLIPELEEMLLARGGDWRAAGATLSGLAWPGI